MKTELKPINNDPRLSIVTYWQIIKYLFNVKYHENNNN